MKNINDKDIILTKALIKLIKQNYITLSSPCNLDRIPYIEELLNNPLKYLGEDATEDYLSEFDTIVVSGNYNHEMLRDDIVYAYDFMKSKKEILVNAGKILHMTNTSVDSDYKNSIIDTQRNDKYYINEAHGFQEAYFYDFCEIVDNIDGMGEFIEFVDEVNSVNCEKRQFDRQFKVSYNDDNVFIVGDYNKATVLPAGIFLFKYVPEDKNCEQFIVESVFSIRMNSIEKVEMNADNKFSVTLYSGDMITIM